jgi:hypothetical protein
MKVNKLALVFSIVSLVVTFLPWYGVESITIMGFGTLMGFVSFILTLSCLVLLFLNKKIALIAVILSILSGIISLGFNSAIWGESNFVDQINQMIKPDQWTKYLSYGGILYLVINIVLIIILIKDKKNNSLSNN